MRDNLVMICPSRGRPDNAAELIRLWPSVTRSARLLVVADVDDPLAHQYRHLGAAIWPNLGGIGPLLNAVAKECLNARATAVGFLGDDHRPRTPGWDRILLRHLNGGVAYGDDLAQGENLPTAVVIAARVIDALGYMVPPGLVHLFLDDFWKRLGTDIGRLAYRRDVVIEHVHPAVGKAAWDEGYRRVNAPEMYRGDQAAYGQFLETQWPGDLARLRGCLDGVEAVRR